MRYKLKERPREPATQGKCRHCWMIESASGPTSRGVCKFCGVEKEFLNSLPEFTVMGRKVRVFDFSDSPDIESYSEQDDSEL